MRNHVHLTYRQMIQLIATCFISIIAVFAIFSCWSKPPPDGCQPVFSGLISSAIDYRSYVTPDAPAVQALAAETNGIEEAYIHANTWLYVPEQIMHGVIDKWELPEQFLTSSRINENNPVPGNVAGDCEEQANTLVSLIRALGVPPEEVRVALGLVSTGKNNNGHVWVEIYRNGQWLALDPSQGSMWSTTTNSLIIRTGLHFEYYLYHPYPVSKITAYYNDVYYTETMPYGNDIPALWKPDDSTQTVSISMNGR